MLGWLKTRHAGAARSAPAPADHRPDPRLAEAEACASAGDAPRAAALFQGVANRANFPQDRAKALGRLADLMQRDGLLKEAKAAIEEALRYCPEDADLNYRLGLQWLAEGDPEQALDLFNLALHYRADFFAACEGRVKALNALGRGREEPKAYRDFLAINADHVDATLALASWHYSRDEREKAVELLEPLARAERPDRRVDNFLGMILGPQMGEFERAEKLLRRALEVHPSWPPALCNLGWLLLDQGKYEEGFACIDSVLESSPQDAEARLIRAHTNLKCGDFESGWRDYDARHASPLAVARPYRFERWLGQPIPGKRLLIYGEQGIGDQLMFASCFAETMVRAGSTIIECKRELARLFGRSFPGAVIQLEVPPAEDPTWLAGAAGIDFQIAMGDLPGLFRNRIEDFPRHSGYLRADPARVAFWRTRLEALGTGLKVGFSWRGGVVATRQRLRSIPVTDFASLFEQPIKAVSLQYGPVSEDLERLRVQTGYELAHWQQAIDDYDETAALVCALDLVVSVCTAVVHLCGALGKAVWVLTPATPEWRYMDRGDTLPWYPSSRVFRQQRPADWVPVITQVKQALEREIRSAKSQR